MNFRLIAIFVFFIIGFVSSNNTQADMIKRKDIIGMWRIESFELERTNGVTVSWAETIKGTLLYTDDGFVSVSLNGKLKEDFKILFYSGTFELNRDGVIKHYVWNASDPNRVNKTMKRRACLHDGVLTLYAEGEYGKAKLKWTKTSTKDLVDIMD
jgi:hypothetical protein